MFAFCFKACNALVDIRLNSETLTLTLALNKSPACFGTFQPPSCSAVGKTGQCQHFTTPTTQPTTHAGH